MYDLVLRDGWVVNGLGSPKWRGDVAIEGDRIAGLGSDLPRGRREIDCGGLVVAPGFIDAHSHSDGVPLMSAGHSFKLLQGVTTEIVGNCGFSLAPLTESACSLFSASAGALCPGVEVKAGSFSDYLGRLEDARPVNHMAPMVGHGTLRLAANGMDVDLAPGALETMQALLADAFEAGAHGISSGLIYVPGTYATTEELAALGVVAARFQRIYATHMRDEGRHLDEALDEALEIGTRAGIRVQISHCKAAGRSSHGQGPHLLERLRAARATGVDVRGDQYPYTAGSTFLSSLLPPVASAGGMQELQQRLLEPSERARLRSMAESAERGSQLWTEASPADILIVRHSDSQNMGRTIAELAGGANPWDKVCDLVAIDPSAMIVIALMDETDVRAIMRDPLISIGSDSGPPDGQQHPRTWGCFPRLFGTYVRELGVLGLEEAVRKSTSMTANHFRLVGRGVLAPGSVADICVFDPMTIDHAGTYIEPDASPSGIEYVVVDGCVAVEGGSFNGERAGRVLRAGAAR